MINIDQKKLDELMALVRSEEIKKDEDVVLCLKCEEPFISYNPRYYRLCERCRNMPATAVEVKKDEWDALLKDIESEKDEYNDDRMFVRVSNWDTVPSTCDDPWDRVDMLIDLAKKMR